MGEGQALPLLVLTASAKPRFEEAGISGSGRLEWLARRELALAALRAPLGHSYPAQVALCCLIVDDGAGARGRPALLEGGHEYRLRLPGRAKRPFARGGELRPDVMVIALISTAKAASLSRKSL